MSTLATKNKNFMRNCRCYIVKNEEESLWLEEEGRQLLAYTIFFMSQNVLD